MAYTTGINCKLCSKIIKPKSVYVMVDAMKGDASKFSVCCRCSEQIEGTRKFLVNLPKSGNTHE